MKWREEGSGQPREGLASRLKRSIKGLIGRENASLTELVAKVATEEGLTPALLHRLMLLESGGVQDAVSATGAVGLMQLTKRAMTDVAAVSPRGLDWVREGRFVVLQNGFDPEQNLRAGARYFKVSARYVGLDVSRKENWASIYVAYNLGAGNAYWVYIGQPEKAAGAIGRNPAYGAPGDYFTNVTAKFADL